MSAGLTSWREPGAGPRSVTISRRAGSPLAETPEGYERGGKAALVKQRRSMLNEPFVFSSGVEQQGVADRTDPLRASMMAAVSLRA